MVDERSTPAAAAPRAPAPPHAADTSTSVARARLLEQIGASLWLIPAVTSLAAFLAAKGLVALDRRLEAPPAWAVFGGSADGALQVLSTIASSVMTFTGLVFSITILVLQLASDQFSPRVLRTFLRDRPTKLAMATFVGTFVFALAVLVEVRSGDGAVDRFVPALSVLVAFVLVLVSVGTFIHYIDHMAHSVRAITLIKRLGAETRRWIVGMYPATPGEGAAPEPPGEPPTRVVVHEGRGGVLSAVDHTKLMALACRADAVVALVPMPGDFVPSGGSLFRVWGGDTLDAGALRRCALIADERTVNQDPAFGFRQLVDVAERALSPAVNDPSTAVQALDELHDLLRLLAVRPFPSPARRDAAGRLRLFLPRPDWGAYVHLALDEIRHYGSRSIQVARRMRALIEDVIAVAPPERRAELEAQLALLDEATGHEMFSPADRALAARPSRQGHGQA